MTCLRIRPRRSLLRLAFWLLACAFTCTCTAPLLAQSVSPAPELAKVLSVEEVGRLAQEALVVIRQGDDSPQSPATRLLEDVRQARKQANLGEGRLALLESLEKRLEPLSRKAVSDAVGLWVKGTPSFRRLDGIRAETGTTLESINTTAGVVSAVYQKMIAERAELPSTLREFSDVTRQLKESLENIARREAVREPTYEFVDLKVDDPKDVRMTLQKKAQDWIKSMDNPAEKVFQTSLLSGGGEVSAEEALRWLSERLQFTRRVQQELTSNPGVSLLVGDAGIAPVQFEEAFSAFAAKYPEFKDRPDMMALFTMLKSVLPKN